MSDQAYDPRSLIIGIDPGLNGAWAIFDHRSEFIGAGELPRFEKTLDASEFSKLIWQYKPARAVVERVSAMPAQGVTSVFTFGAAYGLILGVFGAVGVPVTLVAPAKWKTHFRLTGKPKDASRELAKRLYPTAILDKVKHHGRADAILLARYALDAEQGSKFA